MAVDVTLNNISSGYNLAKLNENFTRIDTALQDAVSLSGQSPNQFTADLDMNSQQLINLIDPTIAQHAATKAYVDSILVGAGAVSAPADPADDGKVLAASGGLYTWTSFLVSMISDAQAFMKTFLTSANVGTARTNLGLGDAATGTVGVDVQAFDATILVDADIGVNVEAFDATIVKDADIGVTVQAFDADTLKADVSDTLTVGMLGTSHSLGNLSTATTLSISNGNLQHATMTGSFTLTAPNDTDDGYAEVEFTIDATGGYTLTLSGFNEISGAIDTTANVVNLLRISKLNTNTYLEIAQAV